MNKYNGSVSHLNIKLFVHDDEKIGIRLDGDNGIAVHSEPVELATLLGLINDVLKCNDLGKIQVVKTNSVCIVP